MPWRRTRDETHVFMWWFFNSCGKVFIGENLKLSGKMIVFLLFGLEPPGPNDFELSWPPLSPLLTWDLEEQRGTSCSGWWTSLCSAIFLCSESAATALFPIYNTSYFPFLEMNLCFYWISIFRVNQLCFPRAVFPFHPHTPLFSRQFPMLLIFALVCVCYSCWANVMCYC